MPDAAHSSHQIVLSRIGEGEVITDLPPQDLLEIGNPRVMGPKSPRGLNLRLLDGVARRRPGYAGIGTAPDTDQVTGLFHSVFDDGSTALARATAGKLYTVSGTTYTDRSGTATFTNNTDNDYWTFAMVPRLGSVTPKNWCMASDTNNRLKIWTDDVTFGTPFKDVTTAAGYTDSPRGALASASFLSRCWVANVLDDGGDRKHARVVHSVTGDSTDWAGAGVVETDLDQDPYPIQQLAVMAGGLVILKGDQFGGSVWRATPTGLLNHPVRYDAMNPGSGVGILLRRSLVLMADSACFFVGHDGFYLYDGVRGFKNVSPGITLSLLRALNYDALDGAFAEYKPRTSEILVHVPTGTNTEPDLTWVYNRRENRTYGPYEYGHVLTASSQFTISGTYAWDNGSSGVTDLDYSGGWGDLPWDAWNAIGGSTGASSTAYGSSEGEIYNDSDDASDNDDGIAVVTAYDTACVIADGRTVLGNNGQPITLGPYDMLTLEDVGIEYNSVAAFTPSVLYSIDDGNTWLPISNSEEVPAGSGEQQWYSWTPQVTARRFMVRVTDSGTNYALHAIHLRLSYAGDQRNG